MKPILPNLLVLAAVAAALPAWGRPEVVLRAPWGSGPDALGARGGDESAEEGPMGFAVAPGGDVVVLDQVNARAVRFRKGRAVQVTPLGSSTFQDVALGPRGELVLLDRLVERVVRVVDGAGRTVEQVSLEGAGVPEGGGVTALLARPDGVWVEYEHRRSVRVLDAALAPVVDREPVGGRPVGGADLLASVKLRGPHDVQVATVDRATDVIRAEAVLSIPEQVLRVVHVDADARGDTLLALAVAGQGGDESLLLVWLDRRLAVKSRTLAPLPVGTREQFKEVELAPDRSVYQVVLLPQGVEVRRWAR